MTIDDDSDDDDDSPPISALVAGLEDVDMFDDPGPAAPSPAELEAIFADVDRQLCPTPGPMQVVDSSPNPEPQVSLSTLQDNPFFTVLSYGSESAIVRLPSGRIVSCLTRDLFRVRADYLPSPAFAPSPATSRHDSPAYAPSPATARHSRQPSLCPEPSCRPSRQPSLYPEPSYHPSRQPRYRPFYEPSYRPEPCECPLHEPSHCPEPHYRPLRATL
jgi:hypothetical protein